ncbi:MAG: tetratricopeptide repeat protein [Alphaproteobacteria bacterium]
MGTTGEALDLGMQLHAAGRLDDAEAVCWRILEGSPFDADALHLLGRLARQTGRHALAVELVGKALVVRPGFPEALITLGLTLRAMGRADAAAVNFRQAIALRPDHPDAHAHLGGLLHAGGRLDEAATCYARALAIAPDLAEAHVNLAVIHAGMERLDDAVAGCRRAIRCQPDLAEAHNNLGNALMALGRWEEGLEALRQAVRLNPDSARMHSNLIFGLDYGHGETSVSHQAERRRWFERHGRHLAAASRPHANPPDPDRRLRVGYVSADFRRHSASYLFGPVLRSHDRALFDVVCYSGTTVEDDLTADFRAMASAWRPTAGLGDDALADLVRADGIDILVDLSGHTAGNRLPVFARKPAPVQVSAWGHVSGTGLPAIDALLGDPVVVPSVERPLFAEAIADLPCMLCYEAPSYTPPVTPLPALARGGVTFGCFSRLIKVSPETLASWAATVRAVPGSRLMIKDTLLDEPSRRADIGETLRRLGLEGDRLVLLGGTSHVGHLAAYAGVDIALDPSPASGGTTTLEGLSMGVPTLTLSGALPASRAAASINTALGLTGFIADSPEAFHHLALTHAADLPELAALRGDLRRRLSDSPVGDPVRYVRAVESVYRTLWRRWCSTHPEAEAPS